MSGSPLFNPAGGVRYHLRARRYARELWGPFRWALGEWLLSWKPTETTLVLVGPSGGYNLQPFLFERFERLVCLEPDPLARWIFRRRLARAPLEHRPHLEFVGEDQLVHHPERFLRLLERLDHPALLFSNVLGQLRVLLGATELEDPRLVRVRDVVRQALANRSWASFHDRVSGELRPSLEGMGIAPHRLRDDELLEAAFADSGGLSAVESAELLDHLTQGFFPEQLPHAYFCWELEPKRYHLIEGVAAIQERESLVQPGAAASASPTA